MANTAKLQSVSLRNLLHLHFVFGFPNSLPAWASTVSNLVIVPSTVHACVCVCAHVAFLCSSFLFNISLSVGF
jgi:hypothetical protein